MKTLSIFDFKNYKEYLKTTLATEGKRRGLRTKLAEALQCQSAFISQVLNGDANFSLEHAVQIGKFLEHTDDESHFFMLLVHQERSGSKDLTAYFQGQIDAILQRRERIQERIDVKRSLSLENQAIYYSSWIYAAAHVLISTPSCQTRETLARRLQISQARAAEIIKFLLQAGLAIEEHGKLRYGEARIHLGADSKLISKPHTNLRLRAIHSLDTPEEQNLHYSAFYSLAEKDVPLVRAMMLKMLEEMEPILRKSPEETAYGIGMDFFRI